MAELYKLTTEDNPFHPVDEYEDWLRFDEDHGYFTNNILDRVGGVGSYQTDGEWYRVVNEAVDWFCDFVKIAVGYNTESKYKKIVVTDDDDIDDEEDGESL